MAELVAPLTSLIDELVEIKARGLKPKQKITIQSRQTSEKGQLFHALAHYITSETGLVTVSSDESLGGSYVGVEQMGLFWSMKRPSYVGKSYGTLTKYNLVVPAEIQLHLYDNFLQEEDIWNFKPIASLTIKRQYICKTVHRIQINNGDICGTLFRPRCTQKLPGVLYIDGYHGGVAEFRASLLANHGFVVLVLGYFKCDNRPDELKYIDLDYVQRGVNFLVRHENVLECGIGVAGFSLGGTIALAISAFSPSIKCVVNICGMTYACLGIDIHYRKRVWKSVEFDEQKISINNGFQNHAKTHTIPSVVETEKHMPHFFKSDASFLFIYGDDDGIMDCDENMSIAKQLFQTSGHNSWHPGIPTDFGGIMKYHSDAQEESWKEIITFLKGNLVFKVKG
uniref:bile acid-CoA:amino acid N-acyltransferase-like n=1 Tax=Styela clava TaxID=7725 RepID=UPI00193AD275|nr:bile acid-CoA:amino acid N-acyltransferase-like [Styela clava]